MEKLNLTNEWDKVFPQSDKELLIIPNANHTDLYGRMDVIPFGKLDAFFSVYLK